MRMTRRMESKFIRTIPSQFIQGISPLGGTYQCMVHFLWFVGMSWVPGVRSLVISTKEKFLKEILAKTLANVFCDTNPYIRFNDGSKFWFTNQMSGFQILDVFDCGDHGRRQLIGSLPGKFIKGSKESLIQFSIWVSTFVINDFWSFQLNHESRNCIQGWSACVPVIGVLE